MSQILDLGEYGIHEVPDDLTPDEIQGFADSFSPPPEVPLNYPRAAIGSTFAAPQINPDKRIISPTLMPADSNWQEQVFRATPEPPKFSVDPLAATGRAIAKVGDVIYEGGVAAMQQNIEEFAGLPADTAQSPGIDTTQAIRSYPKPVQAFIRGGEGLARSLPQMAIAMVNPLAGAAAFGITPEGFDPKAFAIAAALPFAGAKIGKVTEAIAGRAGVSSNQALEAINRLGGVTGAAGLIAADEAYRIAQIEDPKEREDALISAFGNVGSQFLLGGIGPIERGSKVGKASDLIGKLVSNIETGPIQGKLSPQQAAEVNLGLPTRAAAPEMLPELQRTKELVDQAIQEATQKIIIPGQVSALELLRRQTLNLVEGSGRPEFRPGGGETVGGKVSFNRPAEEVQAGRTVAEKPVEAPPVVKEEAPPVVKEEAPVVVEKPAELKPGETKIKQTPEPETFNNIDELLSFRNKRLEEERQLYMEQIGLDEAQASRLQDTLLRDGDTARFEKTLSADQVKKLNDFFEGPFNQKDHPFQTWEGDSRLNPKSVATETDASVLSSVIISAVDRGVESKILNDRFLSAAIAAKRMADLGFTKSDVAKYLDKYTTRESSSQGDKAEYFKSLGTKVNKFLESVGVNLPEGELGKGKPPAATGAAAQKMPWEMTREERGHIEPDTVNNGIFKTKRDAETRLSELVDTISKSPKMVKILSDFGLAPTDAYQVSKSTKSGKWGISKTHQHEIALALREGKPVPESVLADYPNLKPTTPAAIGATAQKMPWEMSKSQYEKRNLSDESYYDMLKRSLAEGKLVPPWIYNKYPDLKPNWKIAEESAKATPTVEQAVVGDLIGFLEQQLRTQRGLDQAQSAFRRIWKTEPPSSSGEMKSLLTQHYSEFPRDLLNDFPQSRASVAKQTTPPAASPVAEVSKPTGIKELVKLTGEDALDPRMVEVGITKAGKPNQIVVEIRDLQSVPIKEVYIKPTGDPISDAAAVVKRIKNEAAQDNRVSGRESSGTLLDEKGHGVTRFTNTPNGPAWASVNDLIQARKQKAAKPETETQKPTEPTAPSPEKPLEIDVPKDSALGKAISKIEEWQKNLRKPSSEGGLQMGVPKAILDLGLETVRLTLKAGKSISEAVEAGIKKIYDSLDAAARKSFDENALRKQLNDTIGVQSPEGMKPRSFSERAAKSEMVPEDVQAQIKTEERSSYEPQKVVDVQERVDKMTDAELGALTPESQDYTLGKAALANRLFKAGNKQAGLDVLQQTSENLTRLGQLINQAKVLNSVKPEYMADVVNAKLEKMGKDPLRPEVAEKITKLSEEKVKAQDELDVATNEWQNNPTDANAKIAQDKLAASEKVQLALQEETLKWTSNRSIFKKLKKILQGNLLTPISQVVNVTSYFGLNPFEAATRTAATAIDILENKMMGTPRVSSVSPIGGTIQTIKGLGRGAAKIPGIMLKGSSGVVLGESSVSMNPLKAWMRQFASQPDMPTEGGKLTLKDRADLLLEGTFGMPAEVMLRGLGALDSAVKESQRARVTAEQLRLNKVPQNQWSMAMKFPEKFFDKKTLDYIESESASAVLQRESKSVNTLNSFLNQQHPAVDFAVATVAPYKLTPWNYLGKLFSYNPAIAIGRGLYEASKGNRKQANEYAARALIGSTVATAAYYLYKYGMVSPSLDKSDEQQKARILLGEVMPPNHVNVSALGRVMSRLSKKEKPTKEDYDFRSGDETKGVFRLGGITGGMIYMMSNIGRSQERKPETGNYEFMGQVLKQSTLEQANFALNQSFLSGVEGLLTAVKNGDESDKYLRQYSKTLLSIPLPNTLSSVGRSMREYKPDFNADTVDKKIENIVRERLSAFGTTKDLPIKRDLWGEPMRETPRDANALVYQLFSITKGQQVTDDPKALELFRLWRATDNSRIIPTPPKQEFDYMREKFQVPARLMERYTELVGKERAAIVDKFVTNPNWHKLSNDEKIKELEWAYEKGMKYGKGQFWDEHEKELKTKPMKTGFQLP